MGSIPINPIFYGKALLGLEPPDFQFPGALCPITVPSLE
jgi:hypothetical protein